MRRHLLCLLAVCALGLAACGDNKDDVSGRSSDSGSTGAQTAAQTPPDAATTPGASSSGCRKVPEAKPKQVGDVKKPKQQLDASKTYTAVLETSCGTIEIRLDVKRAPKTASSFAALIRSGFYDGLAFHRIVPGFVAQGGDPKGTGEGGPGYSVVEAPPSNLKYTKGVVAMAKTQVEEPGTSGSQFFIVTGADAGLPPEYALVGKVSKGGDVLTKLDSVPNDPADNRPTEPVIIEKATIRES
jgi:peptidyl-prolyl cis-trans isomerase B (cyclophilin B)